MKLNRNTTEMGKAPQKFAIVNLEKHWPLQFDPETRTVRIPEEALEVEVREESEFFVIRLRDTFAAPALAAYANAAQSIDPEYAEEVRALAMKAKNHTSRRIPT